MNIIGNEKTIKLLDRIATVGKIANAYLFLGLENVGKFSIAMEFAKNILVDERKINADLIVIAPEIDETKGVIKKRDIKIETIRDLQHKLGLTSTGGRYKVVIIDEAERLNKSAQNALLKTLEEPNEKVVLILVTQNENKMLPTIASRCQKIRFGLVADSEIEKIIPADNNDRQEILFWSIGRPGIAVELIKNNSELNYRRETLRELADMLSKNLNEKFTLAETLSKDTLQLQKKLKLWLIILRQSMLGNKIRVQVSPDKALIMMEGISESMETMRETNSNTRLILENLFLKF
jgi:DNA polymerase-3 subunit delta'